VYLLPWSTLPRRLASCQTPTFSAVWFCTGDYYLPCQSVSFLDCHLFVSWNGNLPHATLFANTLNFSNALNLANDHIILCHFFIFFYIFFLCYASIKCYYCNVYLCKSRQTKPMLTIYIYISRHRVLFDMISRLKKYINIYGRHMI